MTTPPRSNSYPVYPSAFQIIEWPLYQVYFVYFESMGDPIPSKSKAISKVIENTFIQQIHEEFRKMYPPSQWYIGLPNSVFRFRQLTLFVASSVITPFFVCATPMTILADLIMGLVEAAFAKYQGYSKEQIQLILQKKWVAAPLQQLTFFMIHVFWFALLGGGSIFLLKKVSLRTRIICTIPIISMVLGVILYRITRTVIVFFPTWAKPEGFNICIHGERLNRETLKSRLESESKLRKWEDYIKENREGLSTGIDGTAFSFFLNRFIDRKPPQELLELESPISIEAIDNAYKKWSVILHPDKNSDRSNSATVLFKALNEASRRLKEELNNNLPDNG